MDVPPSTYGESEDNEVNSNHFKFKMEKKRARPKNMSIVSNKSAENSYKEKKTRFSGKDMP